MRVAITFTLLLLATTVAAADSIGFFPVGPQAHGFIYDRMEWNQAVSLDKFDYQLGPYPCNHLQLDSTPFADLAKVSGTELGVFSSIGESMRSVRRARLEALEVFRGGIVLRPINRLFVYGNFALDEARAKNPNYLGKKWRGLAGDVEQAFVTWQTEKFDLMAGRFASFWGNQRSLVLGPQVALDGVGYSCRWGRLTLSYQLARLDPVQRHVDTTSEVENRYFAGHRFDVHINDRIRVGVFETVVFGGPGRQIELYYLNPLIFFHGSQVNEGANDNTFVGFDFSVKPAVAYHLYGQVLIDDYQVEKKAQGDQEPNEYGLLVGGYAADILPGYDFRVEYSRVTNWTFNQNFSRNRYLYDNQLISSAKGNDYDFLDIAAIRWFGDQMAVSGHFGLLRQGMGKVSAPWSQPWMDITGVYTEPFPTGVVQGTATFSLGCKGYYKKLAAFDLEVGIDRISNYGHIDGANRTMPFARLSLTALFSTIIDVE